MVALQTLFIVSMNVAAPALAPATALAAPIIVVDDAGPDDEPGQKDLNALSVDYGLPGATTLAVAWNWDDTATSGANTRDGGALFDTDADGFANYSLYVTVAADGTWVTQLYQCTADSRSDRCGGPALVGTFASTASVSTVANSDPFGVPSSPYYAASHVSGNTCDARPGCYTADTVANTTIRLSDFGATAAKLINVCSYPSGEPNSDPSDCVYEPNNGFLTIVKTATPSDATAFTFNASAASQSGTSSWTINGSGSVQLISYAPTATLDLAEVVPSGWTLDSASCAIQTSPATATGTATATGVDNLTIQSGLETICTFTDTQFNPAINVEKSSTTTAITAAGQVVPYDFVVTNTGNQTLTGITVTDPNCDAAPAYVSGDTNGDGKLQLTESWSYTCSHTVTQAEIDAGGNLSNTVTADSNESAPDTDTYEIPVNQTAAIIVVKASTTATISEAGQVVPYTFTVTNGGNQTLTGITVTDPNCDAAPAYVSGDDNGDGKLQLTESWSYTCDHTVTQAEIDADGGGDGDLDNTVTADSNESAPDTDALAIPIDYAPALTVDKSSTTVSLSAPATVTYDYLVTNTGNVTLTGITLSDDNDNDDMTCPADTLDVGATMTCHATHTFTQAELDAGGTLDNTVTADAAETEPVTDSLSIPISGTPAIIVVKASTTATITEAGQVVPYTFTVTNGGNQTLTGITVSDPNCDATPTYVSGDDNGDGKLQLTESWSYTCDHTVTQPEIDAGGTLENTVTADSNESAPDTDTHEIPIAQNPHLTIAKVATESSFAAVGDVLHYAITVTNDGNVTLDAVTVSDPLVSDLTCNPANGSTLAPGETMDCTATHTVEQADIDAGHWGNTACVDDGDLGAPQACDDEDVPGTQAPAIDLVKSATLQLGSDGKLFAGDTVLYEFVIRNTGNVTLTGVDLDDSLLGYTDVDCGLTTLLPGNSTTCTATYTLTQADIDAGSVANTATAAGTPPTGPDVTDTDGTTTLLAQTPAISLVKTGTFDAGGDSFADVGELISYEFLVANDGNVTLTGITVTDPKVTNISCAADTLAVGASMTCTGTYAVTQADIDAGSVYNLATADSNESPPDEDDETVPLPQNPALSLVKTGTFDAGDDGFANVGELITYAFLVTNEGNVSLTGITVTDARVDPIACPETSLAVGASMTCTGTYAVTQADIDAGSVYNLATADSSESPPATDDETVPLPQHPALDVTKTADPTSVPETGGDVLFTFTVANSGNVTLTITSLSDSVYGALDGDDDCKVGTVLAVGASCDFAFTTWVEGDFSGPAHVNVFTGHAEDNLGNDATDSDDATVAFTDVLPTIEVTKTADPTSVPETGGNVTFTFVVKNTSSEEPVTITSLSDSVYGTLDGDDDCKVGTVLAAGASCDFTSTQWVEGDFSGPAHTNVFTAAATDNDGSSATDTDDATVDFSDVAPTIEVTKTANPTSVPETGGDVLFTFVVKNTSTGEAVTITSLSDSVYGALDGDDDCKVGTSLAAGASCDFSVTRSVAGDYEGGVGHVDVFTAKAVDNDDTEATDTDDATVDFTDSTASIDVEKYVSIDGGTTWLDADTATGPYLNAGTAPQFKFVVTNTGTTALSTVGVTDSDFTLPAGCIAGTLAAGASDDCIVTGTWAAGQHTDTATASGSFTDGAGNTESATDTDDANYFGADPTIDLTKAGAWVDGNADGYADVGETISYTFTVTNSGNVPLANVAVTDPKVGTITCPKTTLAVAESMTCTGTYTLTYADVYVAGKVDNTATASGTFTDDNADTKTATDTASATVTLPYRQTGALLPTQTTCQQYAAGPSAWPAMYDAFTYQAKSNKISSVSPGVIFYYNTIVAPSASFTLRVQETNSLSWKPMLIQDLGQAILYTADCSKASGVTVTTGTNPYTVTFTVTGATPGATYYIGIKYSPQNLVGQAVTKGAVSTYAWTTVGYLGSDASIPVKPKK